MIECTNSIEIRRPISTVAFYTANPDRATSWYKNIQRVTWLTPRPVQVGTKVEFEAQFMRRKMRYTYVITHYVPKKELIMEATDGPFPMRTTYQWQAISPEITRMTLTNTGGNFKYFKRWMTAAMNRANQKDLKKLKQILEAHL
ncbi:MAG: SRPBCC family protein [Lewinellaceae bacterium]|nr:SRPBCC family protein [Lewinellaceae bacterium]HPQ98098.1 SRPBCC family protein [Saprospiraceae bacterium]HQU52313.1 SRPBCC family protein [Saprospiraceae bacterium]